MLGEVRYILDNIKEIQKHTKTQIKGIFLFITFFVGVFVLVYCNYDFFMGTLPKKCASFFSFAGFGAYQIILSVKGILKNKSPYVKLTLCAVLLAFFCAVIVTEILKYGEIDSMQIREAESEEKQVSVELAVPEVSIDNIDISEDIDIVDPNTAIIHLENLDKRKGLTLVEETSVLLSVIDKTLADINIECSPTQKEDWVPFIEDTMEQKVNTDSEEEHSVINSDVEFVGRVEVANVKESEKQKGDRETLKEIISLREEAYTLHQTKSLRKLLANNYHEFARLALLYKDWDDAFNFYIKAIKYEILYLNLVESIGNDYYRHMYNIAVLYQCIGDIPVIVEEYKTEAYYLSACFFEIVSKNLFDSGNDRYGFLSSYYAGMVNHKLYLLGWKNYKPECKIYLTEAIEQYEKSLQFEDYKKQRTNQYEYLIQLSEKAQQYLETDYDSSGMKNMEEYIEMEAHYRSIKNKK